MNVSTAADLAPKTAWKLASDLSRFDEWMTIFGGWRSRVPTNLDEGTRVSSCIKVKGFRNTIHWTVTRYDEPRAIELKGRGRGGIRITLAMKVAAAERGSVFHLTADLAGGLLNGPIGKLVARMLHSDVKKSLSNLAALPQAVG